MNTLKEKIKNTDFYSKDELLYMEECQDMQDWKYRELSKQDFETVFEKYAINAGYQIEHAWYILKIKGVFDCTEGIDHNQYGWWLKSDDCLKVIFDDTLSDFISDELYHNEISIYNDAMMYRALQAEIKALHKIWSAKDCISYPARKLEKLTEAIQSYEKHGKPALAMQELKY